MLIKTRGELKPAKHENTGNQKSMVEEWQLMGGGCHDGEMMMMSAVKVLVMMMVVVVVPMMMKIMNYIAHVNTIPPKIKNNLKNWSD